MSDRPAIVRFYSHRRGPYAALSNFYPAPILLDELLWPTSEHYFQACKFIDAARRARIATNPDPAVAKRLGREPGMRADWEAVKDGVMLDALRAKFMQIPALRSVLLATGDARIIEAAPRDYYWGEGADGSGKNMLGVLLMRVRSELALI